MTYSGNDEENLSELPVKDLIRLWREMGRNRDFKRLFELEEGAEPKEGDAFERRYVAVWEMLKKHNLA